MDFRFQQYIRSWLDREMTSKGKKFDYVGFAGSTKSLDIIMSQIDISVRLHGISEVVLVHHEDCGAYGAESTPERHAADLEKARIAIQTKYPDLKVSKYYLKLDGEFVAG